MTSIPTTETPASLTFVSASAQGIAAILPVQVDDKSETYQKYLNTFYPVKTKITEKASTTSKTRVKAPQITTKGDYYRLAEYLGEVSEYLTTVFAHLRGIVLAGDYPLDYENALNGLKSMHNAESTEKKCKEFIYSACTGKMHVIKPSTKFKGGYDIIYSGVPSLSIGSSSCLSANTHIDMDSLPTTKGSYAYEKLEPMLNSNKGKLCFSLAQNLLKSILGPDTKAGINTSAHLRHSAVLPLSFSFKDKVISTLNDPKVLKELNVTTLGDFSDFPTVSDLLIKSLGEFFSILINVEPNLEQLNYVYKGGTPEEAKQPVNNEYLTLQPDISFSFVAHLPEEVVNYITQTTKGSKVSLVALNNWASIWSNTLLRAPKVKAKGGRLRVKNIPRYILTPSETATLNAARKDLGFHSEEGRSNEDDLFVSNTGRLNYCPKASDLSLDNAKNYEALLEKALATSFEAGSPLNAHLVGETHKMFSIISPEYKTNIEKLKKDLDKYAGSLQTYSWDYNCILTTSVANSDALVSTSTLGSTHPDELTLSDYLKRPFCESMAILFNNSVELGTRANVSQLTFTGTSFLNTSLFSNFFSVYKMLFVKGKVKNLQDLVSEAAKEMSIHSLAQGKVEDTGEAAQYEFGLYNDVITESLNLVSKYVYTNTPEKTPEDKVAYANLLIEGLIKIVNASLNDSRGHPRTNLARVCNANGLDIVDDPHYFSAEFFNLSEFKNFFNYLGGRVFLKALQEVQNVPKKDLFTVDTSLPNTLYMPNFNCIVKEVMPLVYILGKYVPNSEEIFEKAEELIEANKKDTSISANNIKIPAKADSFQMFPHQVESNQYLRGKPPRFAILDIAPGGGKTTLLLTDIACLTSANEIKRPVVLCPNGLVRNWIEDMAKVTGGTWNMIPITTLSYRSWGDERLTDMLKKAPRNTIVVVGFSVTKLDSYPVVIGTHVEYVSGTLEFLKKFGFDYVAVDECVTGDTYLFTDNGIKQIRELVPNNFKVGEDTPCKFNVLTEAGVCATATAFKRRKEAFEITTNNGYSIKATSNHPIKVIRPNLSFEWVNVEDLHEGDYLCIERTRALFSEKACGLKSFTGKATTMTSDLARWLGWMVSEGHIGKYRIEFSNTSQKALDDFYTLSLRLFPTVTTTLYDTRVICNGLDIVDYLNYLGDTGLSGEKSIPWTILQSTKEHQVAFLQALYEGDGGIDGSKITYSSKSKKLVKELQIMLLNFGIVSSIHKHSKDMNGKTHYWYQLRITSHKSELFATQIGFLSKRKTKLLQYLVSMSSRLLDDTIPYLNEYRIKLRNTYGYGNGIYLTKDGNKRLSVLPTESGVNLTHHNATQSGYAYLQEEFDKDYLAQLSTKEHKKVKKLLKNNFFFDKITSIKSVGVKTVYDIEVPGPHSFIANGLVVHNCHKAKNANSQLHKAVKQLTVSSSVKYIRLATGTLISNKLTDVVGQAAMFSSQIFRTASEYEDENMEKVGDSKVLTWKEDTPQLARQQLAKHCAVITMKRKEWAFMLPRPLETFIPVRMEKPEDEGGKAHQLMYEAILKETLEEIKRDKGIKKLLKGESDDETDDDDEAEDTKDLPTEDLDDATLLELEAQLAPYLARLEQLLTDPLNDPFGEIYFKDIDPSKFVSNKILKCIDRIRLNFTDFPWVKGATYSLKDIVDYDGMRYVLMGPKGEKLTLESYEEKYVSTLPPNKDSRWKEESRGKVIVFCRYTRTVNAIYAALPPDLKKIALKFHGKVGKALPGDIDISKGSKWDNLNAFKANPYSKDKGAQILIANEQGMSEGHNLQCFPRCTLVHLPDSSKVTLEYIANTPSVEYVQSYNFKTKEYESKKIVRVWKTAVRPEDKYLKLDITLNNICSSLMLTEDHDCYLVDGTKLRASEVSLGDKMLGSSGAILTVTDKQVYFDTDVIGKWKYDLEVEDNHNYFVCAGSVENTELLPVLVSNCASRLIRMESPWAPGELDQSASRIFRPDPSGKFKRENIYLDWILTNNSLEVSKLGRLISKMLTKSKFDESGNPLYVGLKDYNLPLIRMSLDTIASIPNLSDIGEYIDSYAVLAHIESAEFEEMRQTKPSQMLEVDKAPALPDAAIIEHVPYVPGLDILDRHDLGLTKLTDFLEDTSDPEVLAYVEDKKSLAGVYVHTEFGNGIITDVGLSGNSKTPGSLRRISSVTIQLASNAIIKIDQSLVYLASNITEENVADFTPTSNWATKESKQEAARREKAELAQQRKEDKRLAKEQANLTSGAPKDKVIKRPGGPVVESTIEMYQVIYNGFLAIEAKPENADDKVLHGYDYNLFGEYAYIQIPNAVVYEAVLDFMESKFIFSADTIKRLNLIADTFKTRGKKAFDATLAPISEFKNFYTLRHRVSTIDKSTKKPVIKVYPVVMNSILMLNIDIATNPAIKKYLYKSIPGCTQKFDDANSFFIKFFANKTELKRHIKQLKTDKVNISNYDELVADIEDTNFKVGMV